MDVIYWSDYACPFCYIGETNLKKAAEELGIESLNLEMKAFELDPFGPKKADISNVDRFAQKYRIDTEEALDKIKSISIMAQDSGIDFDYSKARFTNTFDAHRLTKMAQDLGVADALAEELYKAYFIDHKELADIETLIQAATAVGMEEAAVRDMLKSDKYADEVRIDEELAHQNGIQAVPFFIVDNKYAVPGALPVETMKEVLKEVIS